MSLIVDASVAVKWLAEEAGSAAARILGGVADPLIAPDLVIVEVGNALWKKLQQGAVSRTQATLGLRKLPSLFAQLHPDGPLSERALELAIDLKHPIYDCFYLALALRENATLVTADARMGAAAKEARVKVRVL